MVFAAVALVAAPLARKQPVAAKGEPASPRSAPALAVVAVTLPLAAGALYWGITNFPWKNPESVSAAPGGHAEGVAGSLADAVKQLEARMAANPQDAEGWQMLGRSYLVTGQAGKAVAAYEKADAIIGGTDAGLKLDLAEALVLTDDPSLQARAKEIIDATLSADPNNGKALWYSGVMAMRRGDKDTARSAFQRLLEQNPPPQIRQVVTEQLAGLGVQVPVAAGEGAPTMGGTAGAAGAQSPETGVVASGRTLRIAISVDPAVAAKLKPGVPLFVAAREPGIPGPPLAAVRLSSDQLPTTVVLSDANSMVEGRNLSSVDNVEVVAHVALGGTPTVTAGDLVGQVQNSKGGPTDVAIVINQVAP
jgi:cytochrome c-type biogenesis protein CcmH